MVNVHSQLTGQHVYISVAYRPAGILCYHDRPTGQGNVYSKLTGQWYILTLNTERPGFCVPITDRLAEVINLHSKPTGQWHILPLHTDRLGFCVTIIDRLAKVTNVHSKPTGQWHIAVAHLPARILCHHYRLTGRGNKCPFKTNRPVAYCCCTPTGQDFVSPLQTDWPR